MKKDDLINTADFLDELAELTQKYGIKIEGGYLEKTKEKGRYLYNPEPFLKNIISRDLEFEVIKRRKECR